MNYLGPYRDLFRIFEDNCSKCNHRHYYKCPVQIPKSYCRCGDAHHSSICNHAIRYVKKSQYVEKKVVRKPIYETSEVEVPIIKYRYETQEVEEDVTKYEKVQKTRKVTKYTTKYCSREIIQNITSGKYITETVPVLVSQSNYNGKTTSIIKNEPRQKFITYTEPKKKVEYYTELIPYETEEKYIEKIPYTVREKVTKTVKIPYTVGYETKEKKVRVGYKNETVEEIKTKETPAVKRCDCRSCTCSKCKPEENLCDCVKQN